MVLNGLSINFGKMDRGRVISLFSAFRKEVVRSVSSLPRDYRSTKPLYRNLVSDIILNYTLEDLGDGSLRSMFKDPELDTLYRVIEFGGAHEGITYRANHIFSRSFSRLLR